MSSRRHEIDGLIREAKRNGSNDPAPVYRALEALADEVDRVPDLIREAISKAGCLSMSVATVVTSDEGTSVAIQLDADEPGNIVSATLATERVQVGQRVIVLHSPGGGTHVIGGPPPNLPWQES